MSEDEELNKITRVSAPALTSDLCPLSSATTRSAFFISDRTGITAESLGYTLLTQFDSLQFRRETVPFIDTVEKASALAQRIAERAQAEQHKPLVFTSIIDPDIRNVLKIKNALVIDFFEAFISQLEKELEQRASLSVGKAHGMVSEEEYDHRMAAVSFSLNHDDGVKLSDLAEADVVLVGVSRSGKTPTCLYLALQYGVKAANYPLVPEDLGVAQLPKVLAPYKRKLFGLTIDALRLHSIRSERRPHTHYASLDNCRYEINETEAIFRQHAIPFISTTHKSVEEIASTIMHQSSVER